MRLAIALIVTCFILYTPYVQAAPLLVPLVGAVWAAYIVAAVQIIAVAYSVYSGIQAGKTADYEQRKARDEYNAGLKDRTATRISNDAPLRYVYGEAKVGSDVVAVFTSGDKDQYKHLVCVHAAHECTAALDVYIGGKKLGLRDSNGWVMSDPSYVDANGVVGIQPYFTPTTQSFTFSVSGTSTFVLHYTPVVGSVYVTSTVNLYGDYTTTEHPFTMSGLNGTVTDGATEYTVTYQTTQSSARVKVNTYLGFPNQAADNYLMSVVPTKWDSLCTLQGLCYSVVTLDLNQSEFQGGIPPVEIVLRGKKLYDPRNGTTTYSRNAALVLYDYLRSPLCKIATSDIPLSSYITAANVCDENRGDGQAKYMISGTITSGQSPTKVMESICQAMAGGLVSTTWECYAGKYVTPVMDLFQEDIVGQLTITPALSDSSITNGVKGQYVSKENLYVSTDYKPYSNPTYVTADQGRENWLSMDFPFSDTLQQVHNLSRIFLEDQRNSFILKATFSLKAWDLRVGNRVRFTSSFLGQSNKVYRVLSKSFSPSNAVELTLKEDDPSIWDYADAVTPDSTPNTSLPNPFFIPNIYGVACQSGTNILLVNSDGTISSRIMVTWLSTVNYASPTAEIQYQPYGSSTWLKYNTAAGETSAFLPNVTDGLLYNIRIRAINTYFNVTSDWTYTSHRVSGKTEAPSTPTGFTYTLEPFGIRLTWNKSPEVDLSQYEVRRGGVSWEASSKIYLGKSTTYFDKVLGSGGIPYFVKAIDTSGNYSTAPASTTAIISVPNTTIATGAISGQDYQLSWVAVAGSFAIDYFEVRFGVSWNTGTLLDKVKTTSLQRHADFGGTRVFWIAAVDVAGNVGNATSTSIVVATPFDVTVSQQVIDNNVLLNWTDATTTLPVLKYEVRKGISWNSGSSVGDNGNGRFAAFFEQSSGVFTYWVMATDTAGNTSNPTNIAAKVDQPPDYILKVDYTTAYDGVKYEFPTNGDTSGWSGVGATVVASTNTLTVTSTSTTPQIIRTMNDFTLYGCEYPTIKVRLRRIAGSGWLGNCLYSTAGHAASTSHYALTSDTSPAIGEEKVISFDMFALTAGGTDWQSSIIQTLRFDFGNTTSDIFEVDWIMLVPYSSNNVTLDNGSLYAALTQESWQNHFTSSGWTTPQDQINAGFPYYWEKSDVSGYYEEILNYGTIIPSSVITTTLTYLTLSGTVIVVPKISYKKLFSDAWTDVSGVTSTFASTFQFVKIRYDFTATGGANLINMTNLNLKVSTKSKSDAGAGNALSTDVGGTVVSFNIPFIDISSITVTPQGTTAPIIPIYDFVGVPNPTSFKVLLYDKTGARVSGAFSWAARGI
jgi:hypothetical protein